MDTVLLVGDRVLPAMEARGWIYWRQTKSLSSIGVDLIQEGDPGARAVKRAMDRDACATPSAS